MIGWILFAVLIGFSVGLFLGNYLTTLSIARQIKANMVLRETSDEIEALVTGYLDMDCKNCGRARLELDGICEKCGFDNIKNKYAGSNTTPPEEQE